MRPLALTVIREEHQALAAMLRSIPLLLAHARRAGEMPDFAVLRAMLFYIDEFPERLHHTKESELLFPVVRARAPEVGDTLDEEEEVLPLAIKNLTAQDWTELDTAFLANRDPLTGHEAADEYRPLFQQILNRAPAPVGLG